MEKYEKDEDLFDMNQPTPVEKPKKSRKIWRIVCAISLSIALFFGGMFTTWMLLDPEIRTLLKVKKCIDENYYEEITDEQFYDTLFDAINGTLLDDYSYYMTPEEYAANNANLAGERRGMGVEILSKDKDGNPILKIQRVCGNSPAERAGVKAGEYIVAFGTSQTEMIQSTAWDDLESFMQERQKDETVYLRLKSQTTREVAVQLNDYTESYVFYRNSETGYGFTGADATNLTENGAPMSALNADTAYIRLVQFGGNAANAFGQAMCLFKEQGKKNLVLDLRGNGGGYLDVMQDIAQYFCKNSTENNPVAAIADYGEKKSYFRAKGNVYYDYFTQDSNIVVLADAYSASATECLLGCMLEYGAISYADICLIERGGVAKTYGKGIMQTTFQLHPTQKDALKLTTAKICWPLTESSIHGRGILPEDGTKVSVEQDNDDMEIASALLQF